MSGFTKRYWAEYTSKEFAALDRDNLIAVLPVGATEQHGPHLPLSVDTSVIDGMVTAVIRHLPASLPVLFLPTQAIGKSNEHARYPGTLTLSAETLIRNWMEIGACVAASGVKKLVLFNSHGGQMSVMDIVARDLRQRFGMLVVASNWYGFGEPDDMFSDHEMQHGIHAGDVETSLMLSMRPELVAMQHAEKFGALTEDMEQRYRHLSLRSCGKIGWQIHDMNPNGACGDASIATKAKGDALTEHVAVRFVELLAEIDQAPLSMLANEPAWC